jgi:exonuclease III
MSQPFRFTGKFIFIVCASVLLALCAGRAPRAQILTAMQGKDTYEIKVITYNVCGLPDFITYDRGLAPTKDRFSYIGEKLQDYDIIALQEVFIPERGIIEQKLKNFYVARGTDVGQVQILGSGVYSFTRWPVVQSHFEKWVFLKNEDAMSLKGFVAARVQVSPNLTIDVYSLHAQTGKSERKKENNQQLYDYMKYMSLGKGNPILLIGDFNCRLHNDICTHMIDIMDLQTADPTDTHVDHMFYNENNSGWTIEVKDAGFAFEEKIKGGLPSDHRAVEAVFVFKKKE